MPHKVKNKPHKQKYFKRENKKVNKENLIEITGTREQLALFEGKVVEVEAYITNTYGYTKSKRLLNEVRILGSNFYIKHAWVKAENLAKAEHGYKKLKVEVIPYTDKVTNETKYGVKIVDTKYKDTKPNKLVIPKWKQEELENEKEFREIMKEN